MRNCIAYLLISTLTIAVLTFWVGYRHSGGAASQGGLGQVRSQLQKEAEIVEYFVLSRIPPMLGRTTGLSEWEKALGSSIRLRDGIGEVSSEAPEFSAMANQLRTLASGEGLAVATQRDAQKGIALAYKIKSGNQYLVVFKPAATAIPASAGGWPLWLQSLIAGLTGGILLTIIRRFLPPPAPAK